MFLRSLDRRYFSSYNGLIPQLKIIDKRLKGFRYFKPYKKKSRRGGGNKKRHKKKKHTKRYKKKHNKKRNNKKKYTIKNK